MGYTTLEQNGLKTSESFLEPPDPSSHPVIISRYMLKLAQFLLHMYPGLYEEIDGLPESPRAMRERLSDLVTNLVTTDDELVGSIEGLECIMIESMYQANVGNLRRSWVVNRRAMGIAQLMGLHRPDNRAQYKVLDRKTEVHPHVIWFRIIYLDRHLSLMLGLPQGSVDRTITSPAMLAEDTPMGRLERQHCAIASRILERNESVPSSEHLDLTRDLDLDLRKAARTMPSQWWLAPNLNNTSSDPNALFWDTTRVFAQLLHFNLLNQLHLPYMLRCSSSSTTSSSSFGSRYEYSRITCVNASREVLSRSIILRRANLVACSCRIVDFLALMAAMTLLLAHLDSHRLGADNLLAHQYPSDRAMIEKAQENMREVNRINSDALSAQSADLLRRMLAIDVTSAGEDLSTTETVSVQEAQSEEDPSDPDDDTTVSVHIPYFGIIKIAREGMTKETARPQFAGRAGHLAQCKADVLPTSPSKKVTEAESYMGRPENFSGSSINLDPTTPVNTGEEITEPFSFPLATANDMTSNIPAQLQNYSEDPLLHQDDYPGLTAPGEDWAFQGVDMAFFDSLMRIT
jgi:hypothetical protein